MTSSRSRQARFLLWLLRLYVAVKARAVSVRFWPRMDIGQSRGFRMFIGDKESAFRSEADVRIKIYALMEDQTAGLP